MGPGLEKILSDIRGLDPKASLVLGAGFVREEWKTLCFQRGFSITGASIQNTRQLAMGIVPKTGLRLMETAARIELLREAFQGQELQAALSLLSAHRMRPRYFEKLDQTLQQGRFQFAHREEADVIAQQLSDKTGNLRKREEFFLLNRFWERLLEVRELWDEPRLYGDAVSSLEEKRNLLPRYYRVEHSREKPRVEWFWSELSKYAEVIPVSSAEILRQIYPGNTMDHLVRKRAHSLVDAANFLFDEISSDLENRIVVIQDSPVVRRTLKRVSEQRGIRLLDSRDPTLVTQSEALKQAILDLELCSKNFTRASVVEWLRYFHPNFKDLRKKIIESAVVQGLTSYECVPEVHTLFERLQARYGTRTTLESLKENVLLSIREHQLAVWTEQVMIRLFDEWTLSLEQLGMASKKRPLRFWFEKIREKLQEVNPVVDPVKNRSGLKLYRVDQCPSLLLKAEETAVHFFGIENAYFEPRDSQGEWFSLRDQEILANEFGWISSSEKSSQNRRSFELWNLNANCIFWEFDYDESGDETEKFDFTLGTEEKHPIQFLHAHPRLLASWKGVRTVPRELETLPLPSKEGEEKPIWPFSFVNAYGNCPFIAYSQHLLRLQDERDVEVELSADRFGTLLHAALEEVLQTPDALEGAFERAWKRTPRTAWEKNDRWYQATRSHVLEILRRFMEDESIYRERSQTALLYSEKDISVDLGKMILRGRIDRIDDHQDGLVVADYKTGSGHSDGRKTLETGKDLQLGLYALAAREIFQKEVITAQYIHLNESKVNRNSGFLFSTWNKGKKADEVDFPISTARGGSRSLFPESPTEVWDQLKAKVEEILSRIVAGRFDAIPADPADCARCRFEGVCGESRR